MNTEITLLQSTGSRLINLDRIFVFNTGYVSAYVLLDGFSFCSDSHHYVDFLIEKFTEKIVDGMNINDVEKAFNDCFNHHTDRLGKASIAIILRVKNKIKSLTIGDVRIYFLNKKVRSTDDSLVQQLINLGKVPGNKLQEHPYRYKLIKYLSKDYHNEISQFSSNFINDEEIIIMCTDGFWSNFNDDEIFNIKSNKKLIELFDKKTISNKDDMSAIHLKFYNV